MSLLDPEHTVSIVIPIFNEEENIELAWDEICQVMNPTGLAYEVVFVDDGSSDTSRKVLRKLSGENTFCRAVFLRRNYGQTAAMHAGIQSSSGEYIVTMDGDLQNDPASIPAMLEKLNEGYDLVHGWRKSRQDHLVSRKLPSWMANKLISHITDFPIHDLGCTMKVMRAEIAKEIELYGEMHRFIPILASNLGARCYEMEVNHRARKFGESKYGIGRSVRVILDLITIKYMTDYFSSPMKFFGMIGLFVTLFSVVGMTAVVIMKLGFGVDVTGNPLTMFSFVSAILAMQFFSLGIIGELSVRIYYGTGNKKSFQVREYLNLGYRFDNPENLKREAADIGVTET